MIHLARKFIRLPVLIPFPAGMTPDISANDRLFALFANANLYCGQLITLASAGTNSALTNAQALCRVLRLTSGASGGFTITLPSTTALIAAMGPTVPTDGTFGFPFSVLNDNVGQTGTLTAGDASTTITGTATVLTNTRRDFFYTVLTATTLGIQNLGSASI